MQSRLIVGSAWWLSWVAIYWLLVGKIDIQETSAGVIVAALATWAMSTAGGTPGAHARFAPRLAWLSLLARVLRNIGGDTITIFGALARRLLTGELPESGYVLVPFDPGRDDREAAARRALVIEGISISPNTVVIAIDHIKGAILVHQLVRAPQPRSADRWWPL